MATTLSPTRQRGTRQPSLARRAKATPDPCEAMLTLTVNGELQTLPDTLTVGALLERLGVDRRRVAVEVNKEVVPAAEHARHLLADRDEIEIVTPVGGGSGAEQPPADKPLVIGKFSFTSRLITG